MPRITLQSVIDYRTIFMPYRTPPPRILSRSTVPEVIAIAAAVDSRQDEQGRPSPKIVGLMKIYTYYLYIYYPGFIPFPRCIPISLRILKFAKNQFDLNDNLKANEKTKLALYKLLT